MLSKGDPAIVLSGIQGITKYADAVAERHDPDAEKVKQECVAILCALIRSEGNVEDGKENAEQNQFEALRVIREHLLDEELSTSWRNLRFDLHDTKFLCPIRLEEAHFDKELVIWGAKFRRSVYAAGAHFKKANFNATEFNGARVNFDEAEMENVTFAGDCIFNANVCFYNATLKNVCFTGNEDYPGRTVFEKTVNFSNARFKKEDDSPEDTLEDGKGFQNAIFKKGAKFLEATFEETEDYFKGAEFGEKPDFSGTPFENESFPSYTPREA